jgi:hypothetical protein
MIPINTARGPVVDIDALYDAMKDGTMLAAGLDVLPEEPANSQRRPIAAWQKNEDWIRHRLLLMPHSAFYTPESMRDNRAFVARTVARSRGMNGWRTALTSSFWRRKREVAACTKAGAPIGSAGRREMVLPNPGEDREGRRVDNAEAVERRHWSVA